MEIVVGFIGGLAVGLFAGYKWGASAVAKVGAIVTAVETKKP